MVKIERSKRGGFFAGIFIISTIVFVVYFISQPGQDMFLRWQYPIRFEQYVQRYAELNGVDENLVFAIIKRESNFRPNAVSHADARGLMQLMPDTAIDVSQRMGIYNFSVDELFDPAVNIRFGVWYIRHLLEMFDGNLVNALAAYNAGQGRVKEWLSNPENVGEDGSLINIPIAETRAYVELVLNAMEMYERLER